MKNIFLKFFLLLILASCASNDKNNKLYFTKIKVDDLKKDVKFVQKKLIKMHPNLYWYISEKALNYKFDSLNKTIIEPLTANEFYLKLSPVVAAVHQGHMNINLMQLKPADAIKKKYKYSTNPLEHFEYSYWNEKLYITKNKSEKDSLIQIGSEVLAINGITPQMLFNKYNKSLTADGYNKTGIPKFFARRINSLYATELGFLDSISIDLLCANVLSKQIVQRKFKDLNVKKKKDNKQPKDSISESSTRKQDTIAEKKISKAEKKALANAKSKEAKNDYKHKQLFGYDYKTKEFEKEISYPNTSNKSTAVLKIRGFSESRIKVYDTIFTEFKNNNVQNLIIDLRGNPGGRINDIYKLSQFLNDTTYKFVKPAIVTNRLTFFNTIRGKSVVQTFFSIPFTTIFATIRAVKTYRSDDGKILYPMKSSKITNPKTNNYKNNLYVITDGMTFSAAAIISSHLKGRNRAIFVGEETSGTFNGTVAGMMPRVKLPNSETKITNWFNGYKCR